MSGIPAWLWPRVAPVLDMSVEGWHTNWRMLYEAAAAGGLGGVLLRRGTRADWMRVTHEAAALGARRPLLMADFEQGAASQMGAYPWLPKALTVGSTGCPDLARALGAAIAAQARDLGIDMVLAPVADVLFPFTHPVIGARSFGATPDYVGAMVAAFVTGCQAEGIKAAVKHFPGHGRSRQDSHRRMARVAVRRDTWMATDCVPFAMAIKAGVAAVMVGHLWFKNVDTAGPCPASRSPFIVGELLRGVLGFTGTVLTDSLEMAGAGGGPDGPAPWLNAGADLVIGPDVGLSTTGQRATRDEAPMEARATEGSTVARRIAERAVGWVGACAEPAVTLPVELHVVPDGACSMEWANPLQSALVTNGALSPGGMPVIAVSGTIDPGDAIAAAEGISRRFTDGSVVVVSCGAWRAAMRLSEQKPVLFIGDATAASQEAVARVLCGEIRATGRPDLPWT